MNVGIDRYMSSATESVKDLVRNEQSRVERSWGHPERRLALLEICRAIDSIVLSARHQADEIVELCRQGANKAISLFLDESCTNRRAPLFASDEQTFEWAHSVLQHCGRIASCEKLLDYEQAGLGEFSVDGEELRFTVTAKYAGLEALEVAEFESWESQVTPIVQKVRERLDSVGIEIHERMESLVYRWEDHYIGYKASPEVDDYFYTKGLLAGARMSGQDAFDDAATFGGLPFGFYKASVLTLVGWSIKHINFALILSDRYRELRLQNLVTVTADIDELTSSLASALDSTRAEASQALSVLEVNPINAKALCLNGHAPPPFVRAATEQFISPVSGFLVEPFQCMLRNLRATWRQDWDRNVNEREALFRCDLFRLLPQDCLIKIPKSVSLKKNGKKLTDVDAVVVDKRNGVLGLFQLKWQDAFGHSMRERGAKLANFYREVETWIETVSSFLAGTSQEEIDRTFGLRNRSQPAKCRLFIVSRYFAHFSGNTRPDGRAAWGVWPQVIRLAIANAGAESPIDALHCSLVADSPFKRKVSVPSQRFCLGGTTIVLEGYERDEVA
jgi:hypothetical protein